MLTVATNVATTTAMSLFIIFSYQLILLKAEFPYCNNEIECLNNSWVTSSSIGVIHCRGYKSLSGQQTSFTNNYNNNKHPLFCFGAFACDDISFISAAFNVYCQGSHSCVNIVAPSVINMTTDTTSDVWCSGFNGCKQTNIRSTKSQSMVNVSCGAQESCTYAKISSVANVYAYGAYSLYGATVDSNFMSPQILRVYLYGYLTGFGGTIICRSGDTCNIYCVHNGCDNLYLDCEDGSNCTIILNSNDTTLTIPPIKNITDFKNVSFDSIKIYDVPENDPLCNTSFVYDDWQQQVNVNINIENGGYVCCRSRDACKFSGINLTNMSNVLVCSGTQSCEQAVIDANGHVFCEGTESCRKSVINAADNVYCVAGGACSQIKINNAKNIYCSGRISCQTGVITANDSNSSIFLLGYLSGDDLDIYCTAGNQCNVTCASYESCSSNTNLYCNNNCIVYCNQDTGCPNGNYTQISLRETTKNPNKSSSNSPTNNPTVNPSKYPSNNPTTDKKCANSEDAILIISFDYILHDGGTVRDTVFDTLSVAAGTFIETYIDESINCEMIYYSVSIKLDDNFNKANINASICFQCANGNSLDINFAVNDLEQHFNETVTDITNVLTVTTVNIIDIEAINTGIADDRVVSTEVIADGSNNGGNNGNQTSMETSTIVIIIMGIVIFCLIGSICGYCTIKSIKNPRKSNSTDMRIQSVSMQSIPVESPRANHSGNSSRIAGKHDIETRGQDKDTEIIHVINKTADMEQNDTMQEVNKTNVQNDIMEIVETINATKLSYDHEYVDEGNTSTVNDGNTIM